ncbi:MAG: hypothetical protein IPH97_12110 [Ignavibacteriales bacterium]|nr:hypothetical protein [Ignavibacteriales bacterium]
MLAFKGMVVLLSLAIILTGCHSFYEIPKEEYKILNQLDDIKIVYKNGREFVVEKDDSTNIELQNSTLIVQSGNDKKIINMSDVNKLKERRSDLGGTITLSVVIFASLLVLFLSANPFKM